jgi:NAD+ synthase
MKIKDLIINWLKDYTNVNKLNGFVVGVSGGIDSAVTSTLCALTGQKTICVSLPINQNRSELVRANDHCKWLQNQFSNVEILENDLTEVFEAYRNSFAENLRTPLNLANLKSRLRMTSLYYIAGPDKLLVVGTGNKIEDFGIGFFTKYGDGGVDISPIADLLKSEVYILAKELNIIESIQLAKPTDGLFENGLSDEEQIGASYDELEWAMDFYISKKESKNLTKRQTEVLEIYIKLNSTNSHKMQPIPVCVIPKNF